MALRKSPHQDFQFNIRQEGGLDEYGRWFNGDDSVKMLCRWEDYGKGIVHIRDPQIRTSSVLGPSCPVRRLNRTGTRPGPHKFLHTFSAKNIIELNPHGSKLVVDDPNFNNDPIQLMSGRAKYKLFGKNSIEIDDFIGAVYNDVKYIGRVTDKDDEKIEVTYRL